ncbi:hypothetical protein [Gimesia alba]|uniref:hypothetical protein n=1 Tax=Gimesia alba TaxID=2527973 RepID=UPI0011AB0482|nr:hypothetical protein [Gimesia alba]
MKKLINRIKESEKEIEKCRTRIGHGNDFAEKITDLDTGQSAGERLIELFPNDWPNSTFKNVWNDFSNVDFP